MSSTALVCPSLSQAQPRPSFVKLVAADVPIHQCHTDVLVMIFQHCLDMTKDDHFLDITSPPWSLSYVCRSWRSIVLTSPTMWNHLHYEYFTRGQGTFVTPGMQVIFAGEARNTASYYNSRPRREAKLVRLLQLFLERSADAPLSLRLDFRLPAQAFDLLAKESHRWQYVTLGGPLNDYFLNTLETIGNAEGFPCLTSVTFTDGWHTTPDKPFTAFRNASRLSKVSMLSLWPDHLHLLWEHLTHLTFSFPIFRHGFARPSLQSCSNVTHLTLLTMRSASRFNFPPITPPIRYEVALPLPPFGRYSTVEDLSIPNLRCLTLEPGKHDKEYAKDLMRSLKLTSVDVMAQ